MEGDIPQKDELMARAVDGRPVTQSEASTIAANESDMTGGGPIKGGAAATAQSLHDRQRNFLEKAGDVARKPIDKVTKKDAAEVQKAEVQSGDTPGRMELTRIQARAKGGPPGKGSTSADVQSLADQNAQARGK